MIPEPSASWPALRTMTVTTLGLTASATLASELMVALLTLAGDEVVVSPSSLVTV